MGGGVGYKLPVIPDHSQEALKLLDGGGRRRCADDRDLLWKRGNTVLVDGVAQELETGFP